MSHMIYKAGGKENILGVMATYKIVTEEELEEHLEDGWLANPNDLLKPVKKAKKQGADKADEPVVTVDEPTNEG